MDKNNNLLENSNIIYESQMSFKTKYKFRSKSIFIDFFESIIKLLPDLEKSKLTGEVISNFASIKVTKLDDFINVLEDSESIYSISVDIVSEYEDKYYSIIGFFSEFESFKKTCYFKLISTEKPWIENTKISINERLLLHKNKFSFIANDFIKALLIGIIQILIFQNSYGKELSGILNPIDFLVFIIYSILLIFIFKIFEFVFIPSFKINTKIGLIKRLILRIKQDGILAALSFLFGIIGIIISIVK